MSEPQWVPPTQSQMRAADAYVDIIIREFRTEDKGVHSETAIAAAGRMAGTFLFRSFNLPLKDLEPGEYVLSHEANVHAPFLIQTLGTRLDALGVNLDQSRLGQGLPDPNLPQVSVTETQARIEKQFRDESAKHRLTAAQSAHACALAAARLIQMTGGVLDPHTGFSLAVFGFVEGSKTVPIPVDDRAATGRPWYRFWE